MPGHLVITEATDKVVVDHAGGLHVGVADGRADETQAALAEVFAERAGLLCLRGDLLVVAPGVLLGFAADKPPDVGIECAKFLLQLQKCLCIPNRGFDFQAVADDAGIGEQLANLPLVVAGHLLGIETVEDFAVALALAQDGVPAQPGLGPLQDEELEEFAVVVDRHAPLRVVIRNVDGVLRPGAANNAALNRNAHRGGVLRHATLQSIAGEPSADGDVLVLCPLNLRHMFGSSSGVKTPEFPEP